MITLKTIPQVTAVERKNLQTYVYLQVGPITIYRKTDGTITYKVSISYFYKEQIDTGKVDENNDPIMMTIKRQLPPVPDIEFTEAQATGIEQLNGGLTGTYHTERFIDLLKKGIDFQLDLPKEQGGHPYLLDHTGWEIYIES